MPNRGSADRREEKDMSQLRPRTLEKKSSMENGRKRVELDSRMGKGYNELIFLLFGPSGSARGTA